MIFTTIVQIITALVSLIAAIISLINASRTKKDKSEVARTKEAILGYVKEKKKVDAISQLKSSTDVFQKSMSIFITNHELAGLNIDNSIKEFDEYMSLLKENDWIFDGEKTNFADDLYYRLQKIFTEVTESKQTWGDMKKAALNVKAEIETFKSVLEKTYQDTIIK
ncbi:hypothetical protein NOM01_11080 [Sporolactobacillus sp. STSJ-5]|uniref:hypothetical protein n=1 Tax=Sporolactobacillus sp. STSJ-5 TaxID=2965076 RepID=UPI0021067462|nr:hypothetical protein [Sporolactobacillus sp. STSJ-5]MCQ2010559.1 hypothetical protein [Sporolactobacillus sp. STSJ-5]